MICICPYSWDIFIGLSRYYNDSLHDKSKSNRLTNHFKFKTVSDVVRQDVNNVNITLMLTKDVSLRALIFFRINIWNKQSLSNADLLEALCGCYQHFQILFTCCKNETLVYIVYGTRVEYKIHGFQRNIQIDFEFMPLN